MSGGAGGGSAGGGSGDRGGDRPGGDSIGGAGGGGALGAGGSGGGGSSVSNGRSGGPRQGERIAVRLRLRGRVQGVGFRYFTRGVARELGVVGRVRNLPDGDVEIEVAGEPERVEEFKTWMRQGPPGAVVAGLDEEPLATVPAWDRFDIDSW